ncbi:MAG: transposase [Planctomycetota bacterium]|nr:transposase [Planctomycetota bacterium]
MAKQTRFDFYQRVFQSRQSGQSIADLARKHSIDPKLLYTYRSYLKREGRLAEFEPLKLQDTLPALLPVVLKSQNTVDSQQSNQFRLLIDRVGVLFIPNGFDEANLHRILSTVRSLPC